MIRTARVVEAGAPGVNPRVQNDDIPSAKSATSRRFWGVRERIYAVSNPSDLPLSIGDTVEIFLPPGRTVASAALTFLLPLALFPVGYALSGNLFKILFPTAANASDAEAIAFLFGFAFLLFGIPLGAFLRRVFGRAKDIPSITRVLNPVEAAACKTKAAEGCGSCTLCG